MKRHRCVPISGAQFKIQYILLTLDSVFVEVDYLYKVGLLTSFQGSWVRAPNLGVHYVQ